MCTSVVTRIHHSGSRSRTFTRVVIAVLLLIVFPADLLAANPTYGEFTNSETGVRRFKNTHQLAGRIPLMTQDLPGIRYDFVDADGIIGDPNPGTPGHDLYQTNEAYLENLPGELDGYWDRGYVPLLNQFYDNFSNYIPESLATIGLELQTKGLPVHVLTQLQRVPDATFVCAPGDRDCFDDRIQHQRERNFWPDDDMWVAGSQVLGPDGTNISPILTEAVPKRPGAAFDVVKDNLSFLKTAGITSIDGLWQDYEARPHRPNGNYEAQRAYVASLPDPVADNPYKDILVNGETVTVFDDAPTGSPYGHTDFEDNWTRVVRETTKNLLRESSRDALDEVYGEGLPYGNYGHNYSGDGTPGSPKFSSIFGGESVWVNTGHSDITSMPVIYAQTDIVKKVFDDMGITVDSNNIAASQDDADHVYWGRMMAGLSTNLANEGENGTTVPWVTQYNPKSNETFNQLRMSTNVFREVLRHAWLRGVDGMISFIPSHRANNDQSLEEMESIRYAMDEMLSYHLYLDSGEILNYDVNPVFDPSPVWSGIKHPTADRAVVRVTGRNPSMPDSQTITFDIQFDETQGSSPHTFTLPAPYDGATYLVHGTGGTAANKHVRIDPRDNVAFLELDDDLANSTSKMKHDATFFKSSPSLPSPSHVDAHPGTQTLSASLGHRENRDGNTGSVYVQRSSTSIHHGTGIRIENDKEQGGNLGAFEADSFTAEVFFSVGSENSDASQTHSAIIGKEGAWYVTIASDGALTFSAEVDNGNSLRNAFKTLPILDGSGEDLHDDGQWHHLAVVFDGTTDQVQLFLDHSPVDWEHEIRGTIVGDNIGQLSHELEHLDTHPSNSGFVRGDILLGKNNFGQGFEGWFDEFRFTPEVLGWGQFLQPSGAPTNPGSGGGAGGVPEPSTALLALICALGYVSNPRRR